MSAAVEERKAGMSALRAAVMLRAADRCEACGQRGTLHLDHFFGRAKAPGAPQYCWALCVKCDDDKTHNRPDNFTWQRKFLNHLAKLIARDRYPLDDLLDPLDRVLARLAVLRQKGLAP